MKFINPFSNLHLSEKHRKWTLPLLVAGFSLFAILTQYIIITTWMLYTVPDNLDTFFANSQYALYTKIVVATIVITCIVRVAFVVYDFFRYNNRAGNKISANYMYWIMSGMLLDNLLFLLLAFILAILVYLITGYNSAEVYAIITNGSDKVKHIYHSIPNLIQLPGLLAAVIIYLVWSFLMYAEHYLGHVSRVYWLLTHRAHHTPTAVTNGTGFVAFTQFAIGWVVAIFRAAIVIIISKLITQDQITLIVVFFVFAVFYQFIEIFNHAPTFYMPIKNNKVFNFIAKIFACGPYHILHHSAHEDHTIVNLGGNSGIWDFVFGTYCELPEKEPIFGLTHQPAIHMSAMAINFGGLQQLFYELKNNKDFIIRFKIIFGDIYYKPPVTKDFLINTEGGFNVVLHLVKD